MTIERWFDAAAEVAMWALCDRSKCGALLVKNGHILGSGYNGPPGDRLDLRVCQTVEPSRRKPKSDRTCCLHAEWQAILDSLRKHPAALPGSTLVFTRVDEAGNLLRSGNPYCTVCSRLALGAEVAFWLLWHPGGIREYSALEYHQVSQRYDEFESAGAVPGGFSEGLGREL